MSFTAREIAADPDTVFAVLADPHTYPAWLVGNAEVRHVDDDWPRPGSSFRHRVGAWPFTLSDTSRVLDVDPSRLLRLDVRARPLIHAVATFRLVGDANRTIVTLEEEPAMRVLGNWRGPCSIHSRTSATTRRCAASPSTSKTVPVRRPTALLPPQRREPRGADGLVNVTGSTVVDAVVIGAGPNGLVGAIDLADHGWDVLVLEAQPEPGGAVRSDEQLGSGVVTDRFSAFYPLAAASPHIARLGLERHGLAWAYAPLVLAHPVLDHPAAVLSRNIERTAASFDRFHQGDGDAWRRHHDDWRRLGDHIVRTVMDPMPPVRAAAGLLARTGIRGAADLARTALLTTRRLGEEWFDGDGARLLITGTALHGDLTPDNASGGFFGWLLAAIGQEDGWPVPRGGSGSLTAALVRRLVHAGGVVECNAPVTRIEIIDGRAVAVVTADGRRIVARRAVLADVGAPQLSGGLVAPEALPRGASAGMRRYQPGLATFKVNWLIDGGVPWSDPDVASAGTVHIARSLEELTLGAAHIASRHLPADPFVLIGQMTTSDPSRSPPGTESVWAYTSIPQRIVGDVAGEIDDIDEPGDAQRFADRLQARIEAYAPGFTSRIRARTIQTPTSIERADANLQRGDKSLGTAQLHQQLVFRPTLGLGRAETGIAGLYLASAAAHPGGGVHGACGANAARAAIAGDRRRSLTSLGRRPR